MKDAEAVVGLIVLCLVTIAVAWGANRQGRLSGWGSLGVALLSALLFQVLAALQLGHLDPFAAIALVLSLAITLPLTWAVGWWRNRQHGAEIHDDPA